MVDSPALTLEELTAGRGDTWTIDTLGGYCPVQGEGTVDGRPWYFRARGEHAEFSVAYEPDGDPVHAGFGWEPGFSIWAEIADWPDAGYLDDPEAFIVRGVALWRIVRALKHPAGWMGPGAVAETVEQLAAEHAARVARFADIGVRANLLAVEHALERALGKLKISLAFGDVTEALKGVRATRTLVEPKRGDRG